MPVFDPAENAYVFEDDENAPFILSEDDFHFLVTVVGNALANTITGNSRSNILNGGLGADTLSGGRGNDYYYVDDAGDRVIEGSGEGNDQVRASISYTLTDNVEDLVLLEEGGNINGTGNKLANSIQDNEGNNILDGGEGNDVLTSSNGGLDTLIGGLGDDVYQIADGTTVLIENAGEGIDTIRSWVSFDLSTNGANIEDLYLLHGTRGTGNDLDNLIVGNTEANILEGKDGNDTLDSGERGITTNGYDQLIGGLGNDTYIVQHDKVEVFENAGEGVDTVIASVDFSLENLSTVENLVITTNSSRIGYGTGNDLDNYISAEGAYHVLYGGKGDDILDGSLGTGALYGGQGNDTFMIARQDEAIFENADEGIDTVLLAAFTSDSVFTLAANVEHLDASARSSYWSLPASLRLTGNTLANEITGHTKIDIISAGSGNDTVYGALGNDVLTGGSGRDFFMFTTKLSAKANLDRITDFSYRDDTIYLENAVFKKLTKTGTLSKSFFKSGSAVKAGDANDYILYDTRTGILSYDADGSGRGAAVAFANLAKKMVSAADFVVM